MPPIDERPRALDFIVSEANGHRSREAVVLTGDANAAVLMPGALLMPDPLPANIGNFIPATGAGATAGNVSAILMYPADIRDGPVEVAIIIRQAEVNAGYLLYYDHDAAGAIWTPAQIASANASLNDNTVIVRRGIPAESLVAPVPFP
jgi:head decoration protein D